MSTSLDSADGTSNVTLIAQRTNPLPVLPFPDRPRLSVNDLDDTALSLLSNAIMEAMSTRGLSNMPQPIVSSSGKPDIYDNARFEQIACTGLQQKYDGSLDRLIPTINLIHICHQNEVWSSATYIMQDGKKLDMIQQFSQVLPQTVQDQAKLLWDDPDVDVNRHKRGTATYTARLFGVFLLNSFTPEFAALLHSRIDPKYSADGPLLFIIMCCHIHRNHLAFVESIKNRIWLATLSDHKNDVAGYLHFLHNNLRIITSTGSDAKAHNDLLPHIFMQLRFTTIPIFQQKVLEWQRKLHGEQIVLDTNSACNAS
jgi:hypothetical protein